MYVQYFKRPPCLRYAEKLPKTVSNFTNKVHTKLDKMLLHPKPNKNENDVPRFGAPESQTSGGFRPSSGSWPARLRSLDIRDSWFPPSEGFSSRFHRDSRFLSRRSRSDPRFRSCATTSRSSGRTRSLLMPKRCSSTAS